MLALWHVSIEYQQIQVRDDGGSRILELETTEAEVETMYDLYTYVTIVSSVNSL